MDQILIQDLLVRGVIGVTERERENPQDILINLVLFADIHKAGQTDNVDDSVNYRTVAKKVFAFTEKAARFTVEALATDIARICLGEPHVQGVRVRVEKPGAVRFSRSVGVEIERWVEQESRRPHQAFVILGSNIDPEAHMRKAVALLGERCAIEGLSGLWETEPVGSSGANFLNQAVWLTCDQSLEELKNSVLRPIEQQLGRVRTADKYAPRTMDLDVVIYDGQLIDERLWELPFMAVPMAELYPTLQHPVTGVTLRQAAKDLRHGMIGRRPLE
jgi:2-amino-4-hydroxy-6-hydroxymethyldihydropteridine diphosphokinase